MIEAFRIGVQMTMDAADTQSTVASLARDFTSLNQQITQSQSGLSAVRAGLIDLAGQQKSLQRDQGFVAMSALWQATAGVPRNESMVTTAPVAHSRDPGSAAGLAAPVAPVGIAAVVDGFQPGRRSEGAVPDPAMASLPGMATLLLRNDPRPSALPDLALLQRSASIGGEGFARPEFSDRSVANSGFPPEDHRLLDDLSVRLAGLGGTVAARDLAFDNAQFSVFPTTAQLMDHYERDSPAVKYMGAPAQPAGWSGGNADDGTASTLALAVGGLSSTATEAGRLMATFPGGVAPGIAHDQSYPRISPPPMAEMNIFRADRQAPNASQAADSVDASNAGSASEASPVVIHTDVHLDGQVIAQAVTHQMVDWMNGPLSGSGGFDPRRSYTPVEN